MKGMGCQKLTSSICEADRYGPTTAMKSDFLLDFLKEKSTTSFQATRIPVVFIVSPQEENEDGYFDLAMCYVTSGSKQLNSSIHNLRSLIN